MIGLSFAGIAIILVLWAVIADEIPSSWPGWRVTRLEKPRTYWSYVVWYGIVAIVGGVWGIVSLAGL